MPRYTCRPVVLIAAVVSIASAATAAPPDEVRFNEHVRPILAANCFACHGFDAAHREADLRLDDRGAALADRDGEAAIVAGDAEASLIWRRMLSADPDEVMPPPATKKTLSDEQKAIIRKWIEQGAPYERHWSFEPPERAVPPSEPITGNHPAGNVVDAFLASRLRDAGLKANGPADRRTLIRRYSFALTGLPPAPADVAEFVADDSPHAVERLVDRYLASPHYGEEQARYWLDLARYGDTHGLHLDNVRDMWPYRDWVVRALNADLPFDQFTLWQLAGDQLPNPTQDQFIATGFNRCNVTTSEGGAINDEMLYRYAVDRTSVMVQTWMGLTAGCAQCHDHKYDPLTAKEFYSLYSFFYSNADPAMDGNIRNTAPYFPVPSPEQSSQLNSLREREEQLRSELRAAAESATYEDPRTLAGGAAVRRVVDVIVDDDFLPAAASRNTSRNPAIWVLDPAFGAPAGRRVLELANSGPYDLSITPQAVPLMIGENAKLSFHVRIDPLAVPRVFSVQIGVKGRTVQSIWGGGELEDESGAKVSQGPLPEAGQWIRMELDLDELGFKPLTLITSLRFQETGGRVWIDDVQLAGDLLPADDPRAAYSAWLDVMRTLNAPGLSAAEKAVLEAKPASKIPADAQAGKGKAARSKAAAEPATDASPAMPEESPATFDPALKQRFLTEVQRPEESPVAALRQALALAHRDRIAHEDTIPGTLIYQDLGGPRDAFVMLRGQYDAPGEPVTPGVPAVFPPLESPPGARARRLDLARWIVSAEHPLTARVAVNRLWQNLFGLGLVKTSDDFGTQGEFPSHPQLLDWLALEYRESGWETKRLLRRLLTSAAFQRDSFVDEQGLSTDPENRWLARGPRQRLAAEQIRDAALASSGLLVDTLGGPGVRPYQPENIWEPVGYANSNTRYYLQDHGPALYRRSVYTFLKRTAPPPFMSNFDGPSREQFCPRRQRSNTPLQALQLLNDVQFFEAARVLAERSLQSEARMDGERIDWLFEHVLARSPEPHEAAALQQLIEQQRTLYSAAPADARAVASAGEFVRADHLDEVEVASWTMVTNLLLNLDETVNRN